MKTQYTILLLITILANFSCSDSFLEKEPLGQETSATFYNSDANAEAGLWAMYNVIRSTETYATDWWVIGSISTNLAEGGGEPGGTDQIDKQRIDQMVHDSRNEVVQEYYYGWYAGIYRANILIQELTDNEYLTPDIRDRILGEAYFMRALCHFELVKTFGGVPVVGRVLAPDELAIPRNTVKEVFVQIENDLNSAMEYLEGYPRLNGRFDYPSARALMVKALVFESSYAEIADPNEMFTGCENRWSEATTIAEDVIAHEAEYGFGLDPDFALIWREAGEGSVEHVIKANAHSLVNYDAPNIGDGSTVFESREGIGNLGCVYQTVRGYYEGGPTDTTGTTEFTQLGWGFNVPTQELVDLYDPGDPRLANTVVFDRDPWTIEVGGDTVGLWTGWSPTGYANRKYMQQQEERDQDANSHAGELDIKIMRYSDFLLLAAEANLRSGNATRATELVNRVRERARNFGGTDQPAAYTSDIGMDEIILERNLELALEGHHFFDLVRWGIAADVLNGHYNNTIHTNIVFTEGKNEFFPIPAEEIIRTNNVLVQNNGY